MQAFKVETMARGYFDEQARFESMRHHAKKAQILQKHEDLRRKCERQVRTFAREARYATSRLTIGQSTHLKRMCQLEQREAGARRGVGGGDNSGSPCKTHVTKAEVPSFHAKKRGVLLFRIEKRDGHSRYISQANNSPLHKSGQQFPAT
ncbi:uncharacterized protein LOC131940573 [Physella acuta]|uniref:uncharacterized protein LOC131940573 n=1 Tax=Physella acuta TaxID=109671 RepID=UPI0027DC50DD|nr:uncharacterized protein LOC131940573 [Physella acuta]